MIEINLLPPEMRRKSRQRRSLTGGFKIPLEVVIGLGGGLLMLLVVAHVVLLGVNFSKMAKHKDLRRQMDAIMAKKTEVEAIMQELRGFQKIFQELSEITSHRQILWSEKLNLVSDVLPSGVWLKRVAFSDQVMTIQGCAISRQNNEMVNVHLFTANLKDTPAFFNHLESLELGSIQRQKIGKAEVADFILSAPLKEGTKK